MTKPIVSVLSITYNHAPYIAQAMESFLEQETRFPFEIVVGEDCSTDGTREIVFDYASRHSEIVRVVTSAENVGMIPNFLRTLQGCRGKYVAICEGDDYWTNPLKLQRQVDFLDSRADCAICFHAVASVDRNGMPVEKHKVPPPPGSTSTLKDIVRRNFIHTCSVMFRAGLVTEFPDWFYESKLGDWPFHVFNAQHGNIGYIDDTMSAYRVHPDGQWSAVSDVVRFSEAIKVLTRIDAHLDFQFSGVTRQAISDCLVRLAVAQAEDGQGTLATLSALKAVFKSPFTNVLHKCWGLKRLIEVALGVGK